MTNQPTLVQRLAGFVGLASLSACAPASEIKTDSDQRTQELRTIYQRTHQFPEVKYLLGGDYELQRWEMAYFKVRLGDERGSESLLEHLQFEKFYDSYEGPGKPKVPTNLRVVLTPEQIRQLNTTIHTMRDLYSFLEVRCRYITGHRGDDYVSFTVFDQSPFRPGS